MKIKKIILSLVSFTLFSGTMLFTVAETQHQVQAATTLSTSKFVEDAGVKNYQKVEFSASTNITSVTVKIKSISTSWETQVQQDHVWINPNNSQQVHVWLEENWFTLGENYEYLLNINNEGFASANAMSQSAVGIFTNGNKYTSYSNNGKFAFSIAKNTVNVVDYTSTAQSFVPDAGVKNYMKVNTYLNESVSLSNVDVELKSNSTGWRQKLTSDKVWQNPNNLREVHFWMEENWFAVGENYTYELVDRVTGKAYSMRAMTTTQTGEFTNGNIYTSKSTNGLFSFDITKKVENSIQSAKFTGFLNDTNAKNLKININFEVNKPIGNYDVYLQANSNMGVRKLTETQMYWQNPSNYKEVNIYINSVLIVPEENYTYYFQDKQTGQKVYVTTGINQNKSLTNGYVYYASNVSSKLNIKTNKKNGLTLITTAEKDAIDEYQRNGDLNDALRSGTLSPKFQTQNTLVQSGLTKLRTKGHRYLGDVYRGSKFTDAQVQQFFPTNGYYTDKAYTSTSTSSSLAFNTFAGGEGNGKAHITIKRTSSGVDLNGYQTNEYFREMYEVLFLPNVKFKVLSKTKNAKGTWIITLEEAQDTTFNYST